jgi:hypothetical protein
MLVHDFVHIDRSVDDVRAALTGPGRAVLADVAWAVAPAGHAVWVGAARQVRDATIVPVRWSVADAPASAELDCDVEITPIGPARTRVAVTGRHPRRSRPGVGDEAEQVARAAVEASVRSFLRQLVVLAAPPEPALRR